MRTEATEQKTFAQSMAEIHPNPTNAHLRLAQINTDLEFGDVTPEKRALLDAEILRLRAIITHNVGPGTQAPNRDNTRQLSTRTH